MISSKSYKIGERVVCQVGQFGGVERRGAGVAARGAAGAAARARGGLTPRVARAPAQRRPAHEHHQLARLSITSVTDQPGR